jgi:hypothetical protein
MAKRAVRLIGLPSASPTSRPALKEKRWQNVSLSDPPKFASSEIELTDIVLHRPVETA